MEVVLCGESFLGCNLGGAAVAEHPGGKGFILLFLIYVVYLFNVCLSHWTENLVMIQDVSATLTFNPQVLAECLAFSRHSKCL